MRIALLAAVCLLAASSALAAPQGMASLRVVNAAARVVAIPEDRPDISVTIRRGRGAAPALRAHRLGPIVTIDGGLHLPAFDPRMGFGRAAGCAPGQAVRLAGRTVRRADLPLIVARVPRDVRIAASGVVFGQVGSAETLSLATQGCGDWTVARVSGTVDISSVGGGRVEIAGAAVPGRGGVWRRSAAAPAKSARGGHGEESARKSLSQRP